MWRCPASRRPALAGTAWYGQHGDRCPHDLAVVVPAGHRATKFHCHHRPRHPPLGTRSTTLTGSALKSAPPRSKRGASGQLTPGSSTSRSASRASSTADRCWRTSRARSRSRVSSAEPTTPTRVQSLAPSASAEGGGEVAPNPENQPVALRCLPPNAGSGLQPVARREVLSASRTAAALPSSTDYG
jgi:hypothetical protein